MKHKLFVPAILFLICNLLNEPVKAQSPNAGFNNGIWLSGSGYGLLYNPALFVTKRKVTLTFGPNIQLRTGKVIGLLAMGEYTACATGRGEITFFASAQHQSNGLIKVMDRFTYLPDVTSEAKDAEEYNTTEFYAGWGVKHQVVKQLYFDWSIGVGFYTTKGNTQYYKNRKLDYERMRLDTDTSLQLKIGLEYRMVKWNKSTSKPRYRKIIQKYS